MRGIRTEKISAKHGVASAILNHQNNLLRYCNLRRLRLSSQNKVQAARRQAMAMHFDHVYIECLDSKSSIGKELEAKHLKDLVLLHLDLIQQQGEDLLAKDKIIKELQDENENLRSRLDRIDRRVSLSCHQKQQTDVAVTESATSSPNGSIKEELKPSSDSQLCSNNNISHTADDDGGSNNTSICAGSLVETSVPSPVLRSQRQDSTYVLSAAASLISSTGCSNSVGGKAREVSPSSRVLRNTSSSPVLKSTLVNNQEYSNAKSSCFDVSPLRHSPRFDVSNSSNSLSSCLEAGRRDVESPSSSSSRSSNSNKFEALHTPTRSSRSDCDANSSSKLVSVKKYPGKTPVKKFSPRDRRTRSDTTLHTEQNTHDEETTKTDTVKLPFISQSESPITDYVITKQQNHVPNTSSINSKRKSEVHEEEPETKKSRSGALDPFGSGTISSFSTAASSTSLSLAVSSGTKSLDYDSGGTTNHSLRSRERTRDSIGSGSHNIADASLEPSNSSSHLVKETVAADTTSSSSSNSSSSYVSSAGGAGRRLRHLSNKSESSSDEAGKNSTPAVEEEEGEEEAVSAQEYERVFIKSAADAANKLREQNAKVPGCSVRAVRSAEGLLSTDEPYFLPTEPPADLTEPCDPNTDCSNYDRQVEIPRWRVSVLSSLYVMEGTENLEDEVFTKRHNKLEQDEKRRKRWDLQRLREQRQYEKLKERYEVRNSSSSNSVPAADGSGDLAPCGNPLCSHHQHFATLASSSTATSSSTGCGGGIGGGGAGGGSACGAGGGGGGGGAGMELVSLWPEPESALYLELVDRVPVCAFGQPCAVTPTSEFSLPWLTAGQQDSSTSRSRRKR